MSGQTQAASNNGIGFFTILALLFIALKLTGHIAWSWWWVLSPLWIPFAIVAGVLIGITLFYIPCLAAAFIRDIRRNRARKQLK